MSTVAASSTDTSSTIRTLEELNNSRTVKKELGKDDFLLILCKQLANQNPLEPASDTDFIAQLAQFSSLQQMQSLNTGFTTSQAYNLLGKYVYVTPSENGASSDTIFGKVDGVIKEDGVDYLIIGQNKYKFSDVSGILNTTDDTSSTDERILQSANLIGKTVTASYKDDADKEQTITGVVQKVTIKDGVFYATVKESDTVSKDVLLTNIKEINI